jgi:hypothetical protein
MPVVPDRVAWAWVQQLARGKPDKAMEYSLVRTSAWDGWRAARQKARIYREWTREGQASYQVRLPRYESADRASVTVTFNFPRGKPPRSETVLLCKTQRRGEWKVCGMRPGE